MITNTLATPPVADGASAPAHEGDELSPLALRKAADRLARRDLALSQNLVHLDAAILRHGQEKVEHLRCLEIRRGRQEQFINRLPSGL